MFLVFKYILVVENKFLVILRCTFPKKKRGKRVFCLFIRRNKYSYIYFIREKATQWQF